ncbi:MAG: DUF1573 domain-containing protein [Clostridia bacterium]|nr:DUF1573 domain-containing protein [Clostridia bacterium]
MKATVCDEFQHNVRESTWRHYSILDIISKSQEASAHLNRAIVKAATSCGCLQIQAERQPFPTNVSFRELKNLLDNHVRGSLCPECREAIETEIGEALFYLAAICNTLDLSLQDIMSKENERLNCLGIFSLA